ncbi:hypothetical protein SeMB42_g03065 [Synchytrium endobioticum]|uniref:Uncharacterized protein n=1 Tax=Synchytrium endobioticum TaxID=286115 RepID=A0A507DA63_9FUNG|nr:hypothetical protein SeMB42_g03065 [Synchytrium endobioticum]
MDANDKGKKPPYSYPLLKPHDVVQCMNDLSIQFEENDIAKPNPIKMMQTYEAITEIFMGISRDSSPFHNGMNGHQDLAFGILEATIEVDVKSPVRRICSAIINFAKFREERMSVFEQCTQKTDELNDQRMHLSTRNAELAEKVNSIRLKRQEEESAVLRLKEANGVLTGELRELKRQQTALTNEIEARKKEKAELVDKMTNNELLITNLKQESSRLRSRIVHSPEKLKQVLVDMNASLASEKVNVQTLEKKAREIQARIEMMHVVEQDVNACVGLLHDCEEQKSKFEEAQKLLTADRESVAKKEGELRELKIKEQSMKRQLMNSQEKLQRLQKYSQQKRDKLEERLGKLRDEYGATHHERAATQGKIDECIAVSKETEEKSFELARAMDAEMTQIQTDFARIKSQLELYMDEMRSIMNTDEHVLIKSMNKLVI